LKTKDIFDEDQLDESLNLAVIVDTIVDDWHNNDSDHAYKMLLSLRIDKAMVITGQVMRKLGPQENAKFLAFLKRRAHI
jgi:hypothetical protein